MASIVGCFLEFDDIARLCKCNSVVLRTIAHSYPHTNVPFRVFDIEWLRFAIDMAAGRGQTSLNPAVYKRIAKAQSSMVYWGFAVNDGYDADSESN